MGWHVLMAHVSLVYVKERDVNIKEPHLFTFGHSDLADASTRLLVVWKNADCYKEHMRQFVTTLSWAEGGRGATTKSPGWLIVRSYSFQDNFRQTMTTFFCEMIMNVNFCVTFFLEQKMAGKFMWAISEYACKVFGQICVSLVSSSEGRVVVGAWKGIRP